MRCNFQFQFVILKTKLNEQQVSMKRAQLDTTTVKLKNASNEHTGTSNF